MANYPSYGDIQQAIQNPAIRFNDPVLKKCTVSINPFGLPIGYPGNFALTFRLNNNDKSFAVRCFTRSVTEREQRYEEICKFLSTHPSPYFINTRYLSEGIRIEGIWYPITTMDWVKGCTLEKYVIENTKKIADIAKLPITFRDMVSELERLQIAHGDLSHRNILVGNGNLILVDYDGMFVPALKGNTSTELGSQYFQHPQRSKMNFDEKLDRFSEIVIYLALKGLSYNPTYYNQFEKGGEGLLFSKNDFVNPDQSKILSELERITDLKPLVQTFRRICLTSINNVPRLEDFLVQKPVELPRIETSYIPSIPNTPYFTKDASNKNDLLSAVNKMSSVVGQITNFHEGRTQDERKAPYVFFNFGNRNYPYQTFTIVMWAESLRLLNLMGKNPSFYYRKWVCVNGLISNYMGNPQIELTSPTDIEVLSNEEAARLLLNSPKSAPIDNKPAYPSDLDQVKKDEEHTAIRPKTNVSFNLPPSQKTQNASVNISSSSFNVNEREISNKLNQLYPDKPVPSNPKITNPDIPAPSNPKVTNLNNPISIYPFVTNQPSPIPQLQRNHVAINKNKGNKLKKNILSCVLVVVFCCMILLVGGIWLWFVGDQLLGIGIQIVMSLI